MRVYLSILCAIYSTAVWSSGGKTLVKSRRAAVLLHNLKRFERFKERYRYSALTYHQYKKRMHSLVATGEPIVLNALSSLLSTHLPNNSMFKKGSLKVSLGPLGGSISGRKGRIKAIRSLFDSFLGKKPVTVFVSAYGWEGSIFSHSLKILKYVYTNGLFAAKMLPKALGGKKFSLTMGKRAPLNLTGDGTITRKRSEVIHALKSGKYDIVIEQYRKVKQIDLESLRNSSKLGVRLQLGTSIVVYYPAIGIKQHFSFSLAHSEPHHRSKTTGFKRISTRAAWHQSTTRLSHKIVTYVASWF